MKTPPENTEVHRTTLLDCWFGTDGILYSVSKPAERTIRNYDELFEVYKKLSKNGTQKLCTLGDISNTGVLPKGVREYITAELPRYLKAMALVSDTAMGKTVGTFFKELSREPYPTALFDREEEAVQWLKQYL
jgi:hypothetical protein